MHPPAEGLRETDRWASPAGRLAGAGGQRPLLSVSNAPRGCLIALALVTALAGGVAGVIYPSPFAPLLVGTSVAALGAVIAFLRKPVWALYAAVFVVLLPIGLIPPDIHSYLNRSLTVAAAAVWLVDWAVRGRRMTWTGSALLMLGFIMWGMVTVFWAADTEAATTVLQTYALRFILYLVLVADEIRVEKELGGLLRAHALSGWVLLLATVGTIATQGYKPGTRLRVAIANENELGILALVALSGVLWPAVRPMQPHRKWAMLSGLLFLLSAAGLIAMSGSRGSAISLLVTIILFCCWKPTRVWGVVSLLCVTLGVALTPSIFSVTFTRFAGQGGDTALGGREALWLGASWLIRDHIWGGVGIGNSPGALISYLRPLRDVWEHQSAAIHNPPLTILAETGILGLVLYLAVMVSAIWRFIQQWRRGSLERNSHLSAYCALVASVFLGFMFSWIKGGGMESDFTYFAMLALLQAPSHIEPGGWEEA